MPRECPAPVVTHQTPGDFLTSKEPEFTQEGSVCFGFHAGVSLGNGSVAAKVRHLLSDTSGLWVESALLVMSACDLRWLPCAAPYAPEPVRVSWGWAGRMCVRKKEKKSLR